MKTIALAVVLCALILAVLSACTESAPADVMPDGPGALAADAVGSQQQIANARATAQAIERRSAAATASVLAQDRVRAISATATEQAYSLAIRRDGATATARAQAATATADALALAATIDAQHAQATASARDAQATADTRAIEQARAVAAATQDAHTMALAAMQAEASTQIAIERERSLSSTVTALCGISAVVLFIAVTAGLYALSLYASARWNTLTTRPVAGGTLIVVGNTQTGFATRLLPAPVVPVQRKRAQRSAPIRAEVIASPVAEEIEPVPSVDIIDAEPVLTPRIRPAPVSRERRLAVRLLRHSISERGEGGTRLVTSREPGWNSRDWQAARQALDGYVATRKGAGGGTHLVSAAYPTLGELLGGVLAGEATLSPIDQAAAN